MQILVIGGTGALGQYIVPQALAAGHEVTVFDRQQFPGQTGHRNLHVLTGDAFKGDDLANAMQGCDVVVSCIGSRPFKPPVCAPIIAATITVMQKAGIKRLIAVSAYGAGETAYRGFYATFLRLAIPTLIRDKDAMELCIQQNTSLDWTIIRPAMYTNGPKTGHYRTGTNLHLGFWPTISRIDVADFILQEIQTRAFVRQMPTITS